MSSLSHDDFERLQVTLLDLKNQNYTLEDKLRKQKNELGDATARATVLEQELTKAQKVITKSKKNIEVQNLIRDNESLQRKLACQDEEFRIQNQTLLNELSKLVTTNEQLESKLRGLKRGDDAINGNTSIESGRTVENDVEISNLRATVVALREENGVLQRQIASLKSDLQNSSPIKASETVEVSQGGDVIFRRQSTLSNDIPTIPPSETDQKNNSDLSHLKEENNLLKEQNRNFQEQLSQCQEKLKKKQESFMKLQEEKENLFKESSVRLEETNAAKENEMSQLREQINRLQVQLNNGHSGFSEFKAKKMTEIETLQEHIRQLKDQAENGSPEKISELSAQITSLNEEITLVKAQLGEISQAKETFETENTRLEKDLTESKSQIRELESKVNDLEEKLSTTTQTSEKRKSILDEMAIRLQTQSEESSSRIQSLEKELEATKLNLESTEKSSAELTEAQKFLQNELDQLRSDKSLLEKDLQSMTEKLQNLEVSSNKKLSEVTDDHKAEMKVVQAEFEIKLRDLTMQLEIANAQIAEFEERETQLKQEIQDTIEERKIGEKKNLMLIKDLKRQLVSEQQQNQKLSEKLKEVLSDPPSLCEPEKKGEIENDRTSNSSWSIYSGQELPREQAITSTPLPRRGKTNSNESLSQMQMPSDGSGDNSPQNLGASYSNDDYRAMLTKISSLQEENVLLQQRLQMLEHSSSAMAEDLLKKSKIIQFYCMEGKTPIRRDSGSGTNVTGSPSATGSSPLASLTTNPSLLLKNNEKLKKMMKDLLVNSNAEAQKEEMHRMQRMLEETLTKNMFLQQDLENISQQLAQQQKSLTSN